MHNQGGNVMRSTIRVLALILVLLALLVPLATYASGGPCPDDPELSKDCDQEAPPFYVVINRSFEDLTRPGTGCQPIILNNPDCTDCCGEDEACAAASDQVEEEVCPLLAEKVEWVSEAQTEIVYEMCCNCATDPDGTWKYRVRLLTEDGRCPIDEQNPGCYDGLPPGTGVDLPAPVIVGGLAVIGAGLLGVGLVLRRRSVRIA
jgi:hypothetical protein